MLGYPEEFRECVKKSIETRASRASLYQQQK